MTTTQRAFVAFGVVGGLLAGLLFLYLVVTLPAQQAQVAQLQSQVADARQTVEAVRTPVVPSMADVNAAVQTVVAQNAPTPVVLPDVNAAVQDALNARLGTPTPTITATTEIGALQTQVAQLSGTRPAPTGTPPALTRTPQVTEVPPQEEEAPEEGTPVPQLDDQGTPVPEEVGTSEEHANLYPGMPDTAEKFLTQIVKPCPQGETNCRKILVSEVVPNVNNSNQIIGWRIDPIRPGNRPIPHFYAVNTTDRMQFGWMHQYELRKKCGISTEETRQLGFQVPHDVGSGIPGGFVGSVEGLSFYWVSSEYSQLALQTMEQRCSGDGLSKPTAEIVEPGGAQPTVVAPAATDEPAAQLPGLPMTAQAFMNAVVLPCPAAAEAGCYKVQLTDISAIKGDGGKTIGWQIQTGGKFFFVKNITTKMQPGWMHVYEARLACGVSELEAKQIGLSVPNDVGAGIPGGFEGPVEGLSFYWVNTPYSNLENQTIAQRCA